MFDLGIIVPLQIIEDTVAQALFVLYGLIDRLIDCAGGQQIIISAFRPLADPMDTVLGLFCQLMAIRQAEIDGVSTIRKRQCQLSQHSVVLGDWRTGNSHYAGNIYNTKAVTGDI